MILWTIQNTDVYNIIKNTGSFTCKQQYAWANIRYANTFTPDVSIVKAYNWMRHSAMRKIGGPVNRNDALIWTWYRWSGEKTPKPDLRCKGYGAFCQECVLLKLDIPEDKILLSDFVKWNLVLGNMHVNKSRKEFDDYEDLIKTLTPEQIEYRKIRSWNRIFDLRDVVYDPLWDGKLSNASIQGVIWEIQQKQIMSVQHFIAR